MKSIRYTGRPSPYYKESHRKLRDYVRAWCDEVRLHPSPQLLKPVYNRTLY